MTTTCNNDNKPDGGRLLHIAVGSSRLALFWENKAVSWGEFLRICKTPIITRETTAQYAAMTKEQRGEVKDVGGFVGGYLIDGKRKKEKVSSLSMATLDIDEGTPDTWSKVREAIPYAALLYSTHSYTPEAPRYRLIIPFSRDISAGEYEPVCRRLTAKIDAAAGRELFDKTTYAVGRLFYWPSVSCDARLIYETQEGPYCDPDALKAEPLAPAAQAVADETPPAAPYVGELGNPRQKSGIIGAFCAEYSIQAAIAAYLPDVYLPTNIPDRYTLKEGTTKGGLVIYDNLWAYSFHSHDVASGHCYNAYDLVRVHLFGNDNRSIEKMNELALKDTRVRRRVVSQRAQEARQDFSDIPISEEKKKDDAAPAMQQWWQALDLDKRGNIKSTARNIRIILQCAPELAGKLWYNSFSREYIISGDLPWPRDREPVTDADMSNLRVWLEERFGVTGKDKIDDAFVAVCTEHRRNPVRDYFNSLRWDGNNRLDRLIIDYVGAIDNELTRLMTRKHFTAAVKRVFEPGCKYDYCLILKGTEGIGKSTLFDVMGGDYFSDSVRSIDGKDAEEVLKRKVIVELAELAALKKNTVEELKAFITRRVADVRAPYGRITERIPRHVVFCGTTNEELFLKGDTGNRRFWIINCNAALRKYDNMRDALTQDRDQLWAEAVYRYKAGETLYLSKEMEVQARQLQREYNDENDDPLLPLLNEFLDTLLPDDWANFELPTRRLWLSSRRDGSNVVQGHNPRRTFCVREFMEEVLNLPFTDKNYRTVARKVSRWMNNMPDWEYKSDGILRNKIYGRQRFWIRKS